MIILIMYYSSWSLLPLSSLSLDLTTIITITFIRTCDHNIRTWSAFSSSLSLGAPGSALEDKQERCPGPDWHSWAEWWCQLAAVQPSWGTFLQVILPPLWSILLILSSYWSILDTLNNLFSLGNIFTTLIILLVNTLYTLFLICQYSLYSLSHWSILFILSFSIVYTPDFYRRQHIEISRDVVTKLRRLEPAQKLSALDRQSLSTLLLPLLKLRQACCHPQVSLFKHWV